MSLEAAPPVQRPAQAGSQSTEYFGRGLELDAGTDFAADFDGIPLNVPSHVQGPGLLYKDLVVPELVGGVRYGKGPYDPAQGLFAVAGSASLDAAADFERSLLALTYGGARTDRYARFLWADRIPERRLAYAVEGLRNERPWDDLTGSARASVMLRKDGEGPGGSWSFTLLGSEEKTDSGAASPVRPFPAEAGSVKAAKAGDGVWNQRLLLGWRLRRGGAGTRTEDFRVYAGAHAQRLWNNWTYYLVDPEWGDQRELVDRRVFAGFEGAWTWAARHGGLDWTHSAGLQGRGDRLLAAEVAPTYDRERISASPQPVLSARADFLHGAAWARSAVRFAPGWEAFAALRLDAHRNRRHRAEGPWTPQDRGQILGSPRAGLVFTPADGTRFALEAGQGLRGGDALRERQPMLRARSAEASAETRLAPALTVAATAWRLDLESESLFDPTVNAFTGRGPAWHAGVELYGRLRTGPWQAELAWGWNHGAFKDRPHGQDRIPGFVPQSACLAVGWHLRGTTLQAKWRRTGARPLTGDGAARAGAQASADLRVSQDAGAWTVAMEVINAFSRKTYNHEYGYVSRLPGELAEGVWDRHVKAADPQTIRLELHRRF